MRRVYVIWLLRRLVHSAFLKAAVLVWLGWQTSFYVSPRFVWQNAVTAGGLFNYNFFLNALLRTETAVQLSLAAAAVIFVWFILDLGGRLGFFSRVRFSPSDSR